MEQKNSEETQAFLYLQVYERYKELILSGQLRAGTRMPSLRKCSQEWKLSRTTIESAYLQLAAEGYILSRPQSGYFVTDILSARKENVQSNSLREEITWKYDLASSGVDRDSFRFDLWQRYIRSALRQDDRLLTYGEPQGEWDFREVLSEYVRTRRNILCSPEQIVVGAGVQNLLQILCPLLKNQRHTVSFPTPSFVQGSTIFSDYDFQVHYRDKDSDVVYVSPAHMTAWGEIMSVKRRMELLNYAGSRGSLIIEDDYENEFVYLQKPTPSLYGLSKDQNVVYIGSFSRLLLPSIRISFMILPEWLLEEYRKKAGCYNQTASKAEQIALCQFIRDGHLGAQTRRLKRLYEKKEEAMIRCVREIFGSGVSIRRGAAGTRLAVTLPSGKTQEEVLISARKEQCRLRILGEKDGMITFLLSCSSMDVAEFPEALHTLKKILEPR